MGTLVSRVLPLALWTVAYLLARREWHQYRTVKDAGHDLFVYSRGRLVRRMIGVGVMVALGCTLAALGMFPVRSAAGAGVYLALLSSEVLLLLLLPILDLWETARTARPEDLKRQGTRDRRTRTGSRPPR